MQQNFSRTHNTKFFNSSGASKHSIPLLHIEEIDNVNKMYDIKKRNIKSLSQKPSTKYLALEEEK